MKSNEIVRETLVDTGERSPDHEVQMARSDCYNAAKYAIDLHKMLQNTPELEGWVSEKITLANDYLRTVHEYLGYQHQQVDETTSSAIATTMSNKQSPRVGTLFGGSYKPKTPFTKKDKK